MARVELVLFDLDGTLLDGSALPGAMRRTAEALSARLPAVPADDLVAANTAVWQRLWPDVEDDWLGGGRSGDDLTREAWHGTLAAVGAEDAGLLELALTTWDAEQRRAFRLYDDVRPALDALAASGLRVGLLTNGAASVQRLKLATVGLDRAFDPLVISSEVGAHKPDPEVFGVALLRAGVEPEAAWYVGDNLWHDVVPARAAGLATVWLDRHDRRLQPDQPQPDAVLTSLAGLPALLQEPR